MLRAGAGPPIEGSVRALRLHCFLPLHPPASLPRFLASFLPCLLASFIARFSAFLASFLPCFLPSFLACFSAFLACFLAACFSAFLSACLHPCLASSLASSHLASPPSSPPDCIPACMGPRDNTAYGPAHIHSCRLLPARSTRKLSISTIPPCACHDCPPTNRSLRSPSLRLRVQLIYLPAWDYLPSYGIGPYTIVRHGAIYHRAVWDHRLSHG